MAELLLETIENNLFDVGLDSKRYYDEYEECHYLTIYSGVNHVDLFTLWSEPTAGDDDRYFFDSDDLTARLVSSGVDDGTVSLYPDTEEDLVELIEKILDQGLDSLRESS